MLDALRTASKSWISKLLLILLLLSFAFWGVSGQMFSSGAGNAVLTAGGTSVSLTDYRLAYDRQLMVLSQSFGQQVTREQAKAFGVDGQVLSQLAAGAVLDEQSKAMGLGLSEDRLAGLIAEDPAFHDTSGRFSRSQFAQVLRTVGMGEEDYIRNREQVAIRQQIVEAVSDGVRVPDAMLEAFALYTGEQRTVDYIVLQPTLVEPVPAPTDAVLDAWFKERQGDYKAPEYRQISVVTLTPETVADGAAVTEEAIQADYDKNRSRYTTPERRRIEQLVFADRAKAEAALARIRGGETFDAIVSAEGKALADIDLGLQARGAVAIPAVAEAAFALPADGVSDVIDGPFGPVLVRVTQIEPEAVQPLEAVREEIGKALALIEANDTILDIHDGYEDARAGGESMRDAAARLKMPFRTIEAVSRTAQAPDGSVIADIPESNALLAAAFEAGEGEENQPIGLGSNGFVWYQVDGVTPARDRTLDEVRDQVVRDWTAAETRRLLEERSQAFLKEVADGKPIADVASALGIVVDTKRGLRRETPDTDFTDAGVEAIFSTPQGKAGLADSNTAGQKLLFVVTESTIPFGLGPESIPEEERDTIRAAMADDLLGQMVTRLQQDHPVVVVPGAVDRALSF